MTPIEADALQRSSEFLWNSEIWRVAVNVQHRFEDGYEPSDMDSLRLDCRQLLQKPQGRMRHRHTGSLWIDVNRCGLRLERTGDIVVACGDSAEKVLDQFKKLVGTMLVRIEVRSPGGDADFVLEGGMTLRCFPASRAGNAGWGLSPASDERDI